MSCIPNFILLHLGPPGRLVKDEYSSSGSLTMPEHPHVAGDSQQTVQHPPTDSFLHMPGSKLNCLAENNLDVKNKLCIVFSSILKSLNGFLYR